MRNIVYFFGQILFLPHVILFLFSRKKEEIAQDIYARKNFNPSQIHQMYDLSKELLINKYFRTLFYHRTNSFFSKILRVFYPKQSSFIIDVDTKIGGGLQLAHPYSTILNAEKIGKNVGLIEIEKSVLWFGSKFFLGLPLLFFLEIFRHLPNILILLFPKFLCVAHKSQILLLFSVA